MYHNPSMHKLRQAELAGFQHIWSPASLNNHGAALPTLLLLHGTGADERDLLPLGQLVAPGAALLSPRGRVLENGVSPRFFRRLAESVFDEDDMRVRAQELAAFIDQAAVQYGFDRCQVIALGFSNGANIAAAMLLLQGEGALMGAALLSPMVPLVPSVLPALSGLPVFIGAGIQDPIAPPHETERLAALFREADARVTLRWHSGGHTVTQDELESARDWLAALPAK